MALAMSMVMFNGERSLPAAEIHHFLAINWPDLTLRAEVGGRHSELAFEVDSAGVNMAIMPAAIPWADLEGPCSTSLLWPAAAETLRSHSTHAIVAVSGELDPVALYRLLTQVSCAALATSDTALGVYWGSAGLVLPKELSVRFAQSVMPHGPPLDIWVDFRVGKATQAASAGFTAGMAALGHMEFEVLQSPETPAELRKRLRALAVYVLENGPVLNDGDTVGEDAGERIRVAHTDSRFGQQGKVISLLYG